MWVYGSYRSENSVVKSINLNPKHPFHGGVSLYQLIISFFARHAFHISVPDPYRFEYRSAFADPYRIRILHPVTFKMRTKKSFYKSFLHLLFSVGPFTSRSGAVRIIADPDPRGPKTSESGTCTGHTGFIFYSSCLWMLCLVLKQTGHHQNIRNRRAVQFQCGELILVNIYCLFITLGSKLISALILGTVHLVLSCFLFCFWKFIAFSRIRIRRQHFSLTRVSIRYGSTYRRQEAQCKSILKYCKAT